MSYLKNTKKNSKPIYMILLLITLGVMAITVTAILSFNSSENHDISGEDEMPTYWQTAKFTPIDIPLDAELQEYTYYLSECYNVDYCMILAIMQVQSNFTVDAVSDTKDYGLMQINSINYMYLNATLGVSDLREPKENIHSGVYILAKLYEKYKTTDKVLMAYSLGESGAKELWDSGIFECYFSKTVLNTKSEIERKVKS